MNLEHFSLSFPPSDRVKRRVERYAQLTSTAPQIEDGRASSMRPGEHATRNPKQLDSCEPRLWRHAGMKIQMDMLLQDSDPDEVDGRRLVRTVPCRLRLTEARWFSKASNVSALESSTLYGG